MLFVIPITWVLAHSHLTTGVLMINNAMDINTTHKVAESYKKMSLLSEGRGLSTSDGNRYPTAPGEGWFDENWGNCALIALSFVSGLSRNETYWRFIHDYRDDEPGTDRTAIDNYCNVEGIPYTLYDIRRDWWFHQISGTLKRSRKPFFVVVELPEGYHVLGVRDGSFGDTQGWFGSRAGAVRYIYELYPSGVVQSLSDKLP